MKQFNVIVIGGGHAGAEAAAASARVGARTALVTLKIAGIGVMSCNPAIGGLGKGHLVREIDAMDGVMGVAADTAGIQFRLLNRRKGAAVQGPRAQTDRKEYRKKMQALLSAQQNLTIIEEEVCDLVVEGETVCGVVLSSGASLSAGAVVLTAGTFLNGLIHIGEEKRSAGRMGDAPSLRLAARLADLGLARGRLKTGTPPRIEKKTIDWAALEMQPGDDEPTMFSFLSDAPRIAQVSCGITHTNERTHEIIRANLHRSAMYGGMIEGVGPRYCPSIEDKVVRFSDKTSHQIFLEPEGLDDDTVYPNGISSSLPVEVQTEYVHSIVGLERARITQPAYAIEYDYFDPRALTQTLELRLLPGLFLAGQVNGTTGYEEAAAQGLVAGINAAHRALGKDRVIFPREESYIGVMLDDLTRFGVSEPYRMFTSRAEYRLHLRADNADRRLTPLATSLGMVSKARKTAFEKKVDALDAVERLATQKKLSSEEAEALGGKSGGGRTKRDALSFVANLGLGVDAILGLVPQLSHFSSAIVQQAITDALYRPYIARQAEEVERVKRDRAVSIPADFDYSALSGLSHEIKSKLISVRPASLWDAAQVEGVTPAAVALLSANLRRAKSEKSL